MSKIVSSILKTIAESAAITYGGSLCVFLLAALVILVAGVVVGSLKWLDYFFTSPTFALPILCGAALAYFRRRRLSSTAYFAWVLPGLLFSVAAVGLVRSPHPIDAWQELVGVDCQDSECLYQLFFTLPLMVALGYAVSAAPIMWRSHSDLNSNVDG